jgi:hypothetical protein
MASEEVNERDFIQEVREWREKIAPPEKPKGRYMADVRHPLKPRRLDEAKWRLNRAPRRPFEPKPEVPETAPCSKCGTIIKLSEWWGHACFGPRRGVCK